MNGQSELVKALGTWDMPKIATLGCFLCMGFMLWSNHEVRRENLEHRKQFYERIAQSYEKMSSVMEIDVEQEKANAAELLRIMDLLAQEKAQQ